MSLETLGCTLSAVGGGTKSGSSKGGQVKEVAVNKRINKVVLNVQPESKIRERVSVPDSVAALLTLVGNVWLAANFK